MANRRSDAVEGFEHLLVEQADGVVTATLNRPEKKNAITLPMFDALHRLLEAVAADREARVLVLRGAGGNFSSGADLTGGEAAGGLDETGGSLAAYTAALVRERVGRSALALHRLAKPTIAAVEGVAAGAGANLALGCDLVYAAEDARFSQIFVRRALSLDCGGSWLLPRLVGLRKAKELAFFGDWVSAPEARECGLVAQTCPAPELEGLLRERALRLARQAPLALSLIKQSLDSSFGLSFAEALDQEALGQATCAASDDFAEGLRAFFERRDPRFTGG
jgi:2-(1,2-epoxy-1,2-dihydrophenyl)acetyl-CoA isomerase